MKISPTNLISFLWPSKTSIVSPSMTLVTLAISSPTARLVSSTAFGFSIVGFLATGVFGSRLSVSQPIISYLEKEAAKYAEEEKVVFQSVTLLNVFKYVLEKDREHNGN